MGIVRRPGGFLTTIARVNDNFWAKLTIVCCPHDHHAVPVRGLCNATAMCLTIFFQIFHCAELNKIVEATMPVNPYDDRKVFLWRPQENSD